MFMLAGYSALCKSVVKRLVSHRVYRSSSVTRLVTMVFVEFCLVTILWVDCLRVLFSTDENRLDLSGIPDFLFARFVFFFFWIWSPSH